MYSTVEQRKSLSRWRKRLPLPLVAPWRDRRLTRMKNRMGKKPIDLRRVTLATHLILVGYGHWLPNDLRGSGSSEIRKDELKELGDIHPGRRADQPTRDELRQFHRDAEPLLDHPVIWVDETIRFAIAQAFERVIREHGYTCWACAILRDHAHLVLRTHKHLSDEMWRHFAMEAAESLRAIATVPMNHRIWSARPYKVLLVTRHEVRVRIPYVDGNPKKHGLPPQHWDFVSICPWL
jgi:hypothetical protein